MPVFLSSQIAINSLSITGEIQNLIVADRLHDFRHGGVVATSSRMRKRAFASLPEIQYAGV